MPQDAANKTPATAQIKPVTPETIRVEISPDDIRMIKGIRRWAALCGWCTLLAGIAELLTLFGIPTGLLMILLGVHLLALSRHAEALVERREAAALSEMGQRVKAALIYGGLAALLFFGTFAALLTISLVTKQGILSLLLG